MAGSKSHRGSWNCTLQLLDSSLIFLLYMKHKDTKNENIKRKKERKRGRLVLYVCVCVCVCVFIPLLLVHSWFNFSGWSRMDLLLIPFLCRNSWCDFLFLLHFLGFSLCLRYVMSDAFGFCLNWDLYTYLYTLVCVYM